MSTYQQYKIEKVDVINLANAFNKIRNNFANNKIDYKDYNKYYEKYLEAVKDNLLGFDYVTYGYVLFNATVLTKDSTEQKHLVHQNLLLGSFLVKYAQTQELKAGINPIDVYNELNTEDKPVDSYKGEVIDFPKAKIRSIGAK